MSKSRRSVAAALVALVWLPMLAGAAHAGVVLTEDPNVPQPSSSRSRSCSPAPG